MSLCVDDRLVRKLTCIPDSHLHGSPKHVENRNKHTLKKLFIKLVVYKNIMYFFICLFSACYLPMYIATVIDCAVMSVV